MAQDSGLATSDLPDLLVVVALDVYKIYWSITFKDLSVSRQITSFLKNYRMFFLEEGV